MQFPESDSTKQNAENLSFEWKTKIYKWEERTSSIKRVRKTIIPHNKYF